MLQNRLRKHYLNARPPAPPPYQGSALDPLRTSSGPQTPWRISSPLHQILDPSLPPLTIYRPAPPPVQCRYMCKRISNVGLAKLSSFI